MKFEKKQLLDITFQKFMDLGFGEGNLNILEDIVAQDVVGFGTTIDEKLFGVRELQSLLIRQKEQSEGMDISWKINTLDIHISADENSAIFTNEIVLYITENENPIEMYMRFSVVLEYVQDKWIVVHWHGSKPEHVESEKDTWGIQTWKEKAESLEKEVAERTADLVEKNKELSIEAALEKVRSVAMGMKKPEDMLDVCRVISNQLQGFEVDKIRNVQTAIIDENIGQYLCYQFFPAYDQTTIEDTDYHKSPVEQEMVREMLASRDGHFIGSLIGKRLEEFRSHRKEENHFPDPLLDEASEVSYCFLSIGEGGLGMSLYQAMDEGILTLFKRFHQVFSLAYQRFRDIQKAEAQAREAQIEVAVERVRAQSMAMHHPNDLDKVNKEILAQLNWLEIQGLSGVTFYLVDQDGWVKAYDFSSPGNIGGQKSYTLQFDFKKYEMMGYPFRIFEQTDLNYLVADYPLEKLEKAVFEIEEINPEVATIIKEALAKGILTHQWSACARISDGILGIDLVRPPSEVTKAIVLKIAGAFNQAYQRFLDLQKAEAHARESEIDLALERVRAQTMAMHSSEDVGKCVIKMFSELTALGVDEGNRFGIGILNHEKENNQLWTAHKNGDEVNMHIGYIDMTSHPLLKSARKAWIEQVPLHRYVLEGEDLLNYYQLLNHAPDYKIQIPIEKLPKKEIQHCFIFEHGFFYAFSPIEFQPELIQITKRFSSLFEQTYRRYLDLVRAEAQAREAEIELALERVRARTMAMHHTEELKEVIQVVFDQFVGLNIHVDHAGFILDYKEREDMHIWLADHHQGVPTEITIPYFDSPHWNSYLEAKAKQESFFANLLPFEVKNKFYMGLFEWIPELTEEAQQAIFSKPGLAISTVLLDNVGLYIEHYSETPFSAEENKILMRFGKVFQQTYTRFLDLQKAEVQAKEAQIEAALERIRARTMGMHRSEELTEVIHLVFSEMKRLEFDINNAGILVDFKENDDFHVWMADSYSEFPFRATIPFFDHPFNQDYLEQKKSGNQLFMKVYSKSEKDSWFEGILPSFTEPEPQIKTLVLSLPALAITRVFINNIGLYIYNYSGELYSESENSTLIRMAKVFEQAYTRFLDLQKAEAQAREAQIEAAMERVRSRSMAMHKSEELLDAGEIIFVEMQKLGIESLTAGLVLMDKEEKNGLNYVPDPSTHKMFPLPVIIPHDETKPLRKVVEKWKKGSPFFIVEMDEDETIQHQTFIAERSTNFLLTAAQLIAISPARLFLHNFYFKEGYVLIVGASKLTGEQTGIMLRFAKVFQQTYTRFLDLKKAEDQAREAQIEAALERVRSRSMAMHKSEEFPEVIQVVFEQFQQLDFKIDSAQFDVSFRETDDLNLWAAAPGQPYPTKLHIPYADYEVFNSIKKAKKAGLAFVSIQLTKEEKNDFFNYFFLHAPNIPEERKKFLLSSPGMVRSAILLDSVSLAIQNYSGIPYTDAEHAILKRFAKAFEQTYTRFLDLQKAEAQAREAQIEAALEKVRGKAMAMHNSSDLPTTAIIAFSELKKLGFVPIRGGISIQNKENKKNHLLCSVTSSAEGDTFSIVGWAMLDNHPVLSEIYNQWIKGEDYFPELRGDLLKSYYDQVRNSFAVPLEQTEVEQFGYFMHFTHGIFYGWCAKPVLDDDKKLLRRFASVIDLTFKRYFDLQKSEAQAREAQIETAMEKVRSRSLAMQKPDELTEVAELLRKEMGQLGVEELETSSIYIVDKEKMQAECWYAIKDVREENKQLVSDEMTITFTDSWVGTEMEKFYRSKKQHTSILMKGENRKEWINYCAGKSSVLKGYYGDEIPERTYHLVKFNGGYMGAASPGDISEESWDLLRRAVSVFSLAYTRFKDLQDATERAREAQIELALERVRSKTMAMHNSQEVGESVATLFEELVTLSLMGVEDRCGVGIMQPDEMMELWTADKTSGTTSLTIGHLDMRLHQLGKNVYQNWLDKKETYEYTLEGDDKFQYYEAIRNEAKYKIKQDYYSAYEKIVHTDFFFKEGCLFVFSLNTFTTEAKSIFIRFANVFGQTYRRYLDLQNAEAQAKEAQIEAALEKVRSRTMAMQHSDELRTVVLTVYEQLNKLNFNAQACNIVIADRSTGNREFWVSGFSQELYPESYKVPYIDHPYVNDQLNAWKKGDQYNVVEYSGQKKKDFDKIFFTETDFKNVPADAKRMMMETPSVMFSTAFFSHGSIQALGNAALSAENADILKRFAKVFEQTYTRFLDLQKAEDQAREATIEAALEKVRGRAMAMQNSNDVSATITVVFTELQKLGIKPFRSGVGLLTKGSRKIKYYSAGNFNHNDASNIQLVMDSELADHELLSKFYNSWVTQEDYFPLLKGDQLASFFKKINLDIPDQFFKDANFELHGYTLQFPEGSFYGWSEKPFSEEEVKILQRFKTIVALTFRRYLELQSAETNALEALRSASLDRVRAEIASMRTKQDLERITPLIWEELTMLTIPFVRCGVFIMDDQEELIHTFLSTPEGKAIAAFHLPYDSPGRTSEILAHWIHKQVYIEHWDETAFSDLGDLLVKQGALPSKDIYLKTMPQGGIYLHCLPFMQGMLYVGNSVKLKEEDIQLIQSVANAFSTAYARYEDFNKLEAAKEQVEKTLLDLKQAQQQLVQSEKMASLGELTAGIAHEIQNPLNFVNNFSELSVDLAKELKEEVEKLEIPEKDKEYVAEILGDLTLNQEKINHHGKRASDIIKGMLEHSRTSTGQKELRDINSLCDEYLRLSHQGWRSKNKDFNAAIETQFDPNLPRVNIIPQDIGRVILNLINNAFYAVNEKSKVETSKAKSRPSGSQKSESTYSPTVSITTQLTANSQLLIAVKDNGSGIPNSIKEKIFQPFFTTKPTGQGTGLGLSLAYDIVKAHGGELKLETNENKGSKFIIQLPTNIAE